MFTAKSSLPFTKIVCKHETYYQGDHLINLEGCKCIPKEETPNFQRALSQGISEVSDADTVTSSKQNVFAQHLRAKVMDQAAFHDESHLKETFIKYQSDLPGEFNSLVRYIRSLYDGEHNRYCTSIAGDLAMKVSYLPVCNVSENWNMIVQARVEEFHHAFAALVGEHLFRLNVSVPRFIKTIGVFGPGQSLLHGMVWSFVLRTKQPWRAGHDVCNASTCFHGLGHGVMQLAMQNYIAHDDSFMVDQPLLFRRYSVKISPESISAAEMMCAAGTNDVDSTRCFSGMYHHIMKYNIAASLSDIMWPCRQALHPKACFTELFAEGILTFRWAQTAKDLPTDMITQQFDCSSFDFDSRQALEACVFAHSLYMYVPFDVTFYSHRASLLDSTCYNYVSPFFSDALSWRHMIDSPLDAWCTSKAGIGDDLWEACIAGSMKAMSLLTDSERTASDRCSRVNGRWTALCHEQKAFFFKSPTRGL